MRIKYCEFEPRGAELMHAALCSLVDLGKQANCRSVRALGPLAQGREARANGWIHFRERGRVLAICTLMRQDGLRPIGESSLRRVGRHRGQRW